MRCARILSGILLLGWLASLAGAYSPKLPVVKDTAASKALLAQAATAGRCFAIDIMRGTDGVLLKGTSETALPAGRYRLHAPLAMAPLGDLNVSFIDITLTAGDSSRTVTMLHFPVADEFTDLSVDFTAPGGTFVPYAISWSLSGEEAKKNRIKALNPDIDPEKDNVGEGIDTEAPAEAPDGTISVKDLPNITEHLAARGVHIEPLAPVQITAVTTDKITYRTSEKAIATVTLKNCSAADVKAALTVELLAGLDTHTPLHSETLEIPAGASKSWNGSFEVKNLHWGVELHAVAQMGTTETEDGCTFGVTDNCWETALTSGINYSDNFTDPQAAEARIAQMRSEGFTGFESGFWAPDEFGDFTPDTELFFGGQCAYRGTISGTKNIIAAGHKQGLVATVYSNLWGGDGKPSFEMMRKHPDWFSGASFSSDWLEQWPLMEAQKILPTGLWPLTVVNRENSQEALKVHAAELIASHQQFGWDGTRYDSYYSDEWTKMATGMVRKIVEQALPNYLWGYNSLIPNDEKAKALDVMVGGGGLAMEEGIRSTGKQSASLSAYFNTVLTYRDIVWPHGGHLGVCFDKPHYTKGGSIIDDLYLSTFLLAGGAHPYYGTMESQVGQHPRFALRYAEYIYNNRMRPLKAPETAIKLGGDAKPMEWKRLARTLDLDGDHHRLVIHLINPPVDDASLHNPAMKCNPPYRALPVTVTLPAGAKVSGVWDLCPIPDAQHTVLKFQLTGTSLTFTVPEVRFWNTIVIDYSAKEGLS